MFADLPPAPPPLTAQEEALVMCLRVATTLRAEDVGRRMWSVYLGRLRNRDHLRDWVAYAKPFSGEESYGDFMSHSQRCMNGMRRPPRRR
jgi:hypothetical protein